jgi:hypothetical protein
MSSEQLQELRKVERERVEGAKMKRMGSVEFPNLPNLSRFEFPCADVCSLCRWQTKESMGVRLCVELTRLYPFSDYSCSAGSVRVTF